MLTVIKLTTNIPERHSEHISHLVLVFLLLTGKCRLGWNEVWSVNEIQRKKSFSSKIILKMW